MLITDIKELERFNACHRIWQGIPGIVHTKKGRTFVSFYSGNITEAYGNFCAVIMSDSDNNFSEPVAVTEKSGNHRCFDPVLWIDPLGRLWFIWNVLPEEEVYGVICENPDAETLVWGEEFLIGYGVMMNKPLVLSTGEWLFPIAKWRYGLAQHLRNSDALKDIPAASYVYKTSDNGKTFTRHGSSDVANRSYDEHMVYEMDNGVLRMLVRLNAGLGECYSYDRGRNWSHGGQSNIANPSSRFFIKKLKSGRVLLINHYKFTGRNNLTALLSEDDGKTFPYSLLLDERAGVSYPDAYEGDDGFIYIVYDRERGNGRGSLEETYTFAREIITAKISEDDILKGSLCSDKSYLKNVVCKLGKLCESDPDPFAKEIIDDDVFAEKLISSGEKNPIDRIFEEYPLDCMKLTLAEAKKLDSMIKSFLDTGSNNTKALTKIICFVRNGSGMPEQEYPIIEKAREYIDAHYDEEWYVGELADQIKISVYYLSHLFKSVTGTGIIEYRNELRLTNSKRLLIGSDKSIGDIAQEVGFCSAAYFTEVFSKSEKITPNEFRKIHK